MKLKQLKPKKKPPTPPPPTKKQKNKQAKHIEFSARETNP